MVDLFRRVIPVVAYFVMFSSVLNASQRMLVGSYGANDLMIISHNEQIEWRMPNLKRVTDVHFLKNKNIIYAHTSGITEIVPDYASGKGGKKVFSWNVPKQSELSGRADILPKQESGETHSCQPLSDGRILVGVSYDHDSYILEIDRSKIIHKKIRLENYGTKHGAFRNIRKTPQGTYLVTRNGKPCVGLEVDGKGGVLRKFEDGRYVMVRLPNGNTLVAGSDAHRIYEIDTQDQIIWEIKEKDLDGISLSAVCGIQRLANGNTLISLWGGHGNLKSPAIIEVNRHKKVVWKSPDYVKNRVLSVQSLDENISAAQTALR